MHVWLRWLGGAWRNSRSTNPRLSCTRGDGVATTPSHQNGKAYLAPPRTSTDSDAPQECLRANATPKAGRKSAPGIRPRAAPRMRAVLRLARASGPHRMLFMAKVQLLVVDDEPRVTEDLAHRLRELGYEVRTLDSPFGLLAELRGTQPDVVILDIHMPGLSGDSLLQKVRASPEYAHVTAPFVFVSGLSPERLESVSRNAGADAWLSKPVDIQRLQGILQRLTQTGSSSDLRAS